MDESENTVASPEVVVETVPEVAAEPIAEEVTADAPTPEVTQ